MRLCSLGSGSRGNATVIDSGDALLLVDCGFSYASLERRMRSRGIDPADIGAVLVTHEHIDHVRGLPRLRKRLPDAALHMTPGTAMALGLAPAEVVPIDRRKPFKVDGLEITPFPVPHDAADPIQLTVRKGSSTAGFLTDLGVVTPLAHEVLQDCNVLMVECNYDAKRLRKNRTYPPAVKERIAGSHGHLENGDSALLLKSLSARGLHAVIAAHLSEENNRPELALRSVGKSVDPLLVEITVASQDDGTGWIEL